jgi:hypothetical protein
MMTRLMLLTSTLLALQLAAHEARSAPAMPVDAAAILGTASEDALTAFARRAVGGAGGARTANVSRGHHGAGGARTANVSRGHHVNRNANINRNVNVNRTVNRNVNVNRAVVGIGGVGLVRPVRPWVRRPYYGTFVAGVALGTIIAATAIPPAPSSDLCWYWSNSSHTRGYWDYCQ